MDLAVACRALKALTEATVRIMGIVATNRNATATLDFSVTIVGSRARSTIFAVATVGASQEIVFATTGGALQAAAVLVLQTQLTHATMWVIAMLPRRHARAILDTLVPRVKMCAPAVQRRHVISTGRAPGTAVCARATAQTFKVFGMVRRAKLVSKDTGL